MLEYVGHPCEGDEQSYSVSIERDDKTESAWEG